MTAIDELCDHAMAGTKRLELVGRELLAAIGSDTLALTFWLHNASFATSREVLKRFGVTQLPKTKQDQRLLVNRLENGVKMAIRVDELLEDLVRSELFEFSEVST